MLDALGASRGSRPCQRGSPLHGAAYTSFYRRQKKEPRLSCVDAAEVLEAGAFNGLSPTAV